MDTLLTFLIFGLCFLGMAAGLLLARKTLKRGCTSDPESCSCRTDGKDPSSCDK